MGKQRQKKKSSRRRINPLQRKGVQAGINQANADIPAPTGEQVAPVVERVRYCYLCKSENTNSNIVIDSFRLRTLLNVLGQQLVSQISYWQMLALASSCCPKALYPS